MIILWWAMSGVSRDFNSCALHQPVRLCKLMSGHVAAGCLMHLLREESLALLPSLQREPVGPMLPSSRRLAEARVTQCPTQT
jgi:hypothetical protein